VRGTPAERLASPAGPTGGVSRALWEDFSISERIKHNNNRRRVVNTYFWRTYAQAELDYLEEEGGQLMGFECKWRDERWRPPTAFVQAYPDSELRLVSPQNYLEFLREQS
jgi:hypothetical protein